MDNPSPDKKRSALIETLESLVIAVILALLIRTYVIEPFWIPSGSMEPTLMPDDRILVSKLDYRFGEPSRGDVVVFKYPLDPSKNYIKRLIGLPGETIEIRDQKLYINGRPLEEDYLPEDLQVDDFGPVVIPEGSYFMMGDNRDDSLDSRYWGPLSEELIIGKADYIFWPISRLGAIE